MSSGSYEMHFAYIYGFSGGNLPKKPGFLCLSYHFSAAKSKKIAFAPAVCYSEKEETKNVKRSAQYA
jgi:hypothetical protein